MPERGTAQGPRIHASLGIAHNREGRYGETGPGQTILSFQERYGNGAVR